MFSTRPKQIQSLVVNILLYFEFNAIQIPYYLQFKAYFYNSYNKNPIFSLISNQINLLQWKESTIDITKTDYISTYYTKTTIKSSVKMKNITKAFFTGLLLFFLMLFIGSCKTCKCPAYSYQQLQQPEITRPSNS